MKIWGRETTWITCLPAKCSTCARDRNNTTVLIHINQYTHLVLFCLSPVERLKIQYSTIASISTTGLSRWFSVWLVDMWLDFESWNSLSFLHKLPSVVSTQERCWWPGQAGSRCPTPTARSGPTEPGCAPVQEPDPQPEPPLEERPHCPSQWRGKALKLWQDVLHSFPRHVLTDKIYLPNY